MLSKFALPKLRSFLELAFKFIISNKRTKWKNIACDKIVILTKIFLLIEKVFMEIEQKYLKQSKNGPVDFFLLFSL